MQVLKHLLTLTGPCSLTDISEQVHSITQWRSCGLEYMKAVNNCTIYCRSWVHCINKCSSRGTVPSAAHQWALWSANPPYLIFYDNQVAIVLASTEKFQSYTKHINLHYYFIYWYIKNSTFELLYCLTDDNIADAFTKALPHLHLQKLHTHMGLICTQGGVLSSKSSKRVKREQAKRSER